MIPTGGTPEGRLRLAVLGPVRVWRGDQELDAGSRQQRLILALLLARAGQPVSVADLVALVWGDRPPRSAVNIVQLHVGHLRRVFEPGLRPRTPGRWLAADAAGYRMTVDADTLDLLRMRGLAQRARAAGDPAEALATYLAALELSHGPCAGAPDVAGRPVPDFEAVDSEYAELVREATGVALGAGAVRSVLPILRRVARQRPLDEAVQAKLVLALAADGQQAEAIALFEHLRDRLRDELGIDPGRDLQQARQAVLQPGAAPAGAVSVRPAQLLPDLPHFTGRDEDLRRLLALIDRRAAAVLAIEGIPGVGKTSLATHLAYRVAGDFPDGQLYADLRGLDPDAALAPGEVLQAFLHALGVRGPDIPDGDRARSQLYRGVLAQRRVLIVLDNVRDAGQVRPLLPGAAGSLVLITSRFSLADLAATHGAHVLTLDVLPAGEARDLLIARVGPAHAPADRRALDEIVVRCGGLPLALAVVAARALTRPEYELTAVARELHDAQGSLDGFGADDPDSDLRAIFSWSYRGLSPAAARLFRLLALHPGPDITLPAAASLGGRPVDDTREALGELVRNRLVTERRSGRYGAHDLIAAYARELMLEDDPEPERDEAADRLLRYYRRAAHAANLFLNAEIDADLPPAHEAVVDQSPAGSREATGWFAAEREVLKAVMRQAISRGRVYDAWQLELTVQGFYQHDGWWHEWATVLRECLDAAQGAGDTAGVANMVRSLAGARFFLGDSAGALTLLERALVLFTELGDVSREALTLRNLGEASFAAGDYDQCVTYLHRALAMAQSLGEPVAQADVLCRLADAEYELGRRAESFGTLGRALALAERLGNAVRRSECHLRRAGLYLRDGRYRESLADWTAAEAIARDDGHRVHQVRACLGRGDTARAMNDRGAARVAWQAALARCNDTDAPRRAAIQRRLAELDQDDQFHF